MFGRSGNSQFVHFPSSSGLKPVTAAEAVDIVQTNRNNIRFDQLGELDQITKVVLGLSILSGAGVLTESVLPKRAVSDLRHTWTEVRFEPKTMKPVPERGHVPLLAFERKAFTKTFDRVGLGWESTMAASDEVIDGRPFSERMLEHLVIQQEMTYQQMVLVALIDAPREAKAGWWNDARFEDATVDEILKNSTAVYGVFQKYAHANPLGVLDQIIRDELIAKNGNYDTIILPAQIGFSTKAANPKLTSYKEAGQPGVDLQQESDIDALNRRLFSRLPGQPRIVTLPPTYTMLQYNSGNHVLAAPTVLGEHYPMHSTLPLDHKKWSPECQSIEVWDHLQRSYQQLDMMYAIVHSGNFNPYTGYPIPQKLEDPELLGSKPTTLKPTKGDYHEDLFTDEDGDELRIFGQMAGFQFALPNLFQWANCVANRLRSNPILAGAITEVERFSLGAGRRAIAPSAAAVQRAEADVTRTRRALADATAARDAAAPAPPQNLIDDVDAAQAAFNAAKANRRALRVGGGAVPGAIAGGGMDEFWSVISSYFPEVEVGTSNPEELSGLLAGGALYKAYKRNSAIRPQNVDGAQQVESANLLMNSLVNGARLADWEALADDDKELVEQILAYRHFIPRQPLPNLNHGTLQNELDDIKANDTYNASVHVAPIAARYKRFFEIASQRQQANAIPDTQLVNPAQAPIYISLEDMKRIYAEWNSSRIVPASLRDPLVTMTREELGEFLAGIGRTEIRGSHAMSVRQIQNKMHPFTFGLLQSHFSTLASDPSYAAQFNSKAHKLEPSIRDFLENYGGATSSVAPTGIGAPYDAQFTGINNTEDLANIVAATGSAAFGMNWLAVSSALTGLPQVVAKLFMLSRISLRTLNAWNNLRLPLPFSAIAIRDQICHTTLTAIACASGAVNLGFFGILKALMTMPEDGNTQITGCVFTNWCGAVIQHPENVVVLNSCYITNHVHGNSTGLLTRDMRVNQNLSDNPGASVAFHLIPFGKKYPATICTLGIHENNPAFAPFKIRAQEPVPCAYRLVRTLGTWDCLMTRTDNEDLGQINYTLQPGQYRVCKGNSGKFDHMYHGQSGLGNTNGGNAFEVRQGLPLPYEMNTTDHTL